MIRRTGVVAASVAALLILLVPADARPQSTDQNAPAGASAVAEVEANRGAVIREVIERWRGQYPSADASQNIAGGEAEMSAALERASADRLLAASRAESFGEALAALSGRWGGAIALEPGTAIPNTLGSTSEDLVFTPITPCRIVDTRTATGGWAGKIGPNSGNWFSVNLANFSAQGGATSCPGMPTTFNPAAIAINLTSTGQTGAGNLRVVACGAGTPVVSLLNYLPGANLANAAVVSSAVGTCSLGPPAGAGPSDIYVYSTNSASDVVVDIMGYYAAPVVTPPDQYITVSATVDVAPGTFTSVVAPACPAGYRLTGGAHAWTTFSEFTYETTSRPEFVTASGANLEDNWQCQVGVRTGGATNGIRCMSVCARIPGR